MQSPSIADSDGRRSSPHAWPVERCRRHAGRSLVQPIGRVRSVANQICRKSRGRTDRLPSEMVQGHSNISGTADLDASEIGAVDVDEWTHPHPVMLRHAAGGGRALWSWADGSSHANEYVAGCAISRRSPGRSRDGSPSGAPSSRRRHLNRLHPRALDRGDHVTSSDSGSADHGKLSRLEHSGKCLDRRLLSVGALREVAERDRRS